MNGLAGGIVETANALRMDPLDLATIISYETAGTFDPVKAGPTTQWGQHRGLIQWGEPQARQYGVDWNDPLGSQLGADGAIVRYFQNAGWEPGMGMLDAYSAVNAGRVGRYNASDAGNGGAPGTVRDKVEQQMHGHRQKAAALLGMDTGGYNIGIPRGEPPVNALAQMPQVDPVALMELAQRQRTAMPQEQPTTPSYDYEMPMNALIEPPQYDRTAYNLRRLTNGA